jgi:hypothetical protein
MTAMDADTFDKLQGMSLMVAMSDEYSADMRFTACSLTICARIETSQPLLALVGKAVQAVAFVPDRELAIAFAGGDTLKADLSPGSHAGQRAFVLEYDGAAPAFDW